MSTDKIAVLVEDDPIVRRLIRHRLEQEGYQVRVAENGLQGAILCAVTPTPKLVVVDLYLPMINGLKMLQGLRKASGPTGPDWFSQMGVVVVSGVYSHEDPMGVEVEEMGYSLLTKPFRVCALMESIDNAINKAQNRSAPHLAAVAAQDAVTSQEGPAA